MSLNMFLDQSETQASTASLFCRSHIEGMEAIKTSISQFVAEEDLKGKTYDSAKHYFQQIYIPLANGIILIAETLEKAIKKLPEEYKADVDANSLQEDVLRSHIQQLNNLAMDIESLTASANLSPLGHPSTGIVDTLHLQAQESQKKLDKLIAFDGSSTHIFSELDVLFNNVESGLKAITNGRGFSNATGIFDSSLIDTSWISPINSSYNIYMKEHIDSKMPNLNAQDIAYLQDYATNHPDEDVPKSWQTWLINMIQGGYGYVGQYSADITSLISLGVVKFGGIKTVLEAVARSEGPNAFAIVNPASKGPEIVQKGLKLGKFAKGLGPALSVVGFGLGMADDMMNDDKTLGEATVHSGTSTLVGVGAAAGGSFLTTTALVAFGVSNPAGWAILGGAAVGFVAVKGFDYLYDNNILGIKDGLDWTGEKIDQGLDWAGDKLGECVEGVGKVLNPMNWSW
ncbi:MULTISPECIES: T7SS effector LXG polymorphic toxin [Listeria]|uniref:T7SS effector LXG polymorphic toxin n=1 Tax=Listeria TaxID=1637 RepID=UPI000B59532B|nr:MULTISPECIES: T7SS effector LXG polymorphic toxin [Listeria]